MTKIDKTLIFGIIFVLVFATLWVVRSKENKNYLSYQPREMIAKKIEIVTPEAPKEEHTLPAPGLVCPYSITYTIVDDIAFRKTVIKNMYVKCNVLKKIKTKDGSEYFLIDVNQEGFLPGVFVISKKDVVFL
jgi:hypothetical protein